MQHVGPLVNNVLSGVIPILKESCFETHGMLTPEEFVQAGDELVARCGTWSWSRGSDDYIISYLPSNKQFLVCRSVPEQFSSNVNEINQSDGWTDCNFKSSKKMDIDDIADIDNNQEDEINNQDDKINNNQDDEINNNQDGEINNNHDDCWICTDENVDDCEDIDEMCIVNNDISNINRYDISITYNNYYRTPQVWIIGYNPDSSIIHPLNLLNNISSDHTNKTATIEGHPHTGIRQLSIHPCRHSQTLLSLVRQSKNKYNIQNSMFLFIKIISTIVPNINYDFTFNM
jgi:ubiquitin-like-conjugating enzyme ATG3